MNNPYFETTARLANGYYATVRNPEGYTIFDSREVTL